MSDRKSTEKGRNTMKKSVRFFFLLSASVAALGLVTSVATAQSKKHDKKPKPVDTASDNPYGDESSSSKTADAAPQAPQAPPPELPASTTDGGVKISPLTPPPAEFAAIDAGPPVDYDRILSDLAALRARTNAIAANLFRSRILVNVASEADHAKITRLVLSLDDGVVYTSATAPSRGESSALLSRALAPGKHAVTVEVERKDDRNDAFKTNQRSRFVVEVRRDEELKLDVTIIDSSSMGGDFPSDKSGKYDLRIQMKAESKPAKK